MKYIRQLFVIVLFSFLGEGLKSLLPLPVPAGIYGLLLLSGALQLHIIKKEAVADTGKFLIEIMPLMFIPAGVGLIDAWDVLRPVFVPVTVIVVLSTVVVMVVSGRAAQRVIRKKKEGGGSGK